MEDQKYIIPRCILAAKQLELGVFLADQVFENNLLDSANNLVKWEIMSIFIAFW